MEGVYAPLVAGVALGLLCLAVVIRHPGKAIKLPELSQSDIESDSECSSDDDAVNDDSVSSDKTVAAALSPIPPAAGASNLRRRRNGGNNKSGSSRAGPETVMMPHTASISAGQQDAVAGLQHQPDQASGNPTSELQRAFFNTDDPAVVRKMYQVAKRKADKQAAAGRAPKRTASDNVRLCFKCLDWAVILGLLGFIVYLMHTEYGIDLVGIAAASFPREADVIGRVMSDILDRVG